MFTYYIMQRAAGKMGGAATQRALGRAAQQMVKGSGLHWEKNIAKGLRNYAIGKTPAALKEMKTALGRRTQRHVLPMKLGNKNDFILVLTNGLKTMNLMNIKTNATPARKKQQLPALYKELFRTQSPDRRKRKLNTNSRSVSRRPTRKARV